MTEPEVCKEKHKRVDELLDTYGERLDVHDDDIKELKRSDTVNTITINQLCKSLSGLTKAMWAMVMTVFGALISFFFYAVQSGVFNKIN